MAVHSLERDIGFSPVKTGRWVSGGGAWLFGWVFATLLFWLVGKATGDGLGWPGCAAAGMFAVVFGELSQRWHRYRRSRKQRRVPSVPPDGK